ncbi:MAG: TlpA disulfide reductase family protein [Gammaproteobacteria bacterium]|jgi:peroxiredoxin
MLKLLRLFIFATGLFALFPLTAGATSISGKAPDFTLHSRSGHNLRLSDYRGQVVLLNFWASWCGPCRQEMPLLNVLYKRYNKLGFTILGVNVDTDSTKANHYLRDIKVSFPILYDTRNSVVKTYNVNAMPTTVIIDKNGNMRFMHQGYKPGYENEYRKEVVQLLREN